MTTYHKQFGHLHGKYLKPKKAHSHPGDDPGGKGGARGAKPMPKSRVPQRPPDYEGKLPPPPPPPESLGIPDLPADIAATVSQILAQDPENGAERALAYIRGTDWYKTTYFGIAAGIKSGVVGNEGDYRSWIAGVKDVFKQHYGRDPTQDEIAQFLQSGFSVGTVQQIGEGHAWVQANAGDVQYELGAFDSGQLTPEQLQALGEQQAGRSSGPGAAYQARLQAADAKMRRIFEGVLATPGFSLGGAGLSAPSLQTKQKADVGA